MATLKEQIDEARKSGYSDEQIEKHVQEKYLPSKIQEAKDAGYSESEISTKVNQVLADSGFGKKSLGQKALGLAGKVGLKNLARAAKSIPLAPVQAVAGMATAQEDIKKYKRIIEPVSEKLKKKTGELAARITPQAKSSLLKTIASSTGSPIVEAIGQALPKEFGPQIESKSVAKEVGEFVGGFTPLDVAIAGTGLARRALASTVGKSAIESLAPGIKFLKGKFSKLPPPKVTIPELTMASRSALEAEAKSVDDAIKYYQNQRVPSGIVAVGKPKLPEPIIQAEAKIESRLSQLNSRKEELAKMIKESPEGLNVDIQDFADEISNIEKERSILIKRLRRPNAKNALGVKYGSNRKLDAIARRKAESKLTLLNERKKEIQSILAPPKSQAIIQSQPVFIEKNKVDSVVALGESQGWRERTSESAHILSENFGVPGTQLRKFGTYGQILDRGIIETTLSAEQRKSNVMTTLTNYFRKMNKAEIDNFVDVADGKAKPISQLVKDAEEFNRKVLNRIADESKGAGLEIRTIMKDGTVEKRPWEAIRDYFPRYYDDKLKHSENFRLDVARKIMEKDGISMSQALAKFENMIVRRLEPIVGNLEKSRQYDIPGFIRDPEYVLNKYYTAAFKRLEFAKYFGKDGKYGYKIISKIPSSAGRDLASIIFDSEFRGQLPSAKELKSSKAANWIKDKVTISMMGTSYINNALQGGFGSYVRFGMKSAVRGLWDAASKFSKSEEMARRSGALMDDIFREIGTTMKSREFLEKSGFSATEKFNRIVADASARHYADDLIVKINKFKGKQYKFLDRELKSFGLNRKAIEAMGFLKPEEVDRIAKIGSDLTQGRASKYDLPLFFQSPAGQVIFQFNNFALTWGKFINQYVIKEAKAGNLFPALRLVAGGVIAGEIPNSVKSILFGRKKQKIERTDLKAILKSIGRRGIDNLAAVGGFGIAADLFMKASSGKRAPTIPGISLGFDTARTASNIATLKVFSNNHGERRKALSFLFNRALPHALVNVPNKALAFSLITGSKVVGERIENKNARK